MSLQRARKRALDRFKHIKTCALARELCYIVRNNRAVLEKEDVHSCCEFISKLCREAGCEEPEASKLIEVGFDFVHEFNGVMLFKNANRVNISKG